MRIWSLHPSLLDARGLVALWRETLLAQHVLLGKTKGYKHHPQLIRFRACPNPLQAIASYLWEVQKEAARRGYEFNAKKICRRPKTVKIKVTRGQMKYEMEHLLRKLRKRDRKWLASIKGRKMEAHPVFRISAGGVEGWEKV